MIGAVASWGRMQVHDTGLRAEYACVVTLAYHETIAPGALERLGRIATRYRVELVPLAELEEAASLHGTPLPDTLGPPEDGPPPIDQEDAADPGDLPEPALDEEDPAAVAEVASWARRTPVAPLVGSRRRIGLRWRVLFLALECSTAIAFALLAVITYQSQTRSNFVQQHGVRVSARVSSLDVLGTCVPEYGAGYCSATQITARLAHRVDGIQTVHASYPRTLPVRLHQRIRVVLDPRNPSYGELAGQPRSSSGIWIVAVILAAVAAVVALLDGRSVLRFIRHRRRSPRKRREKAVTTAPSARCFPPPLNLSAN